MKIEVWSIGVDPTTRSTLKTLRTPIINSGELQVLLRSLELQWGLACICSPDCSWLPYFHFELARRPSDLLRQLRGRISILAGVSFKRPLFLQ